MIKNTVPWTDVISDLNGEEFAGTFYEKELHKKNQIKIQNRKSNQKKRKQAICQTKRI